MLSNTINIDSSDT